jgi:hypothetical protein
VKSAMAAETLHASLLAHLAALAARSPEDESLEIAHQCLRESFGQSVCAASESSPPSLHETFTAGLAMAAAEAPPSLASPSATPAATSNTNFERFVDALKQRGYFAGSAVGDAEYERRLQEAAAQFTAKYGTPMPAAAAAAAATSPAMSASAAAATSAVAHPPPAAGTDTMLQATRALLAEGDCARSLVEATRAIDSLEGGEGGDCLVDLLELRALALMAAGQHEAALADAETATALASEPGAKARCHAHLALALEGVARWPQACQEYARALAAVHGLASGPPREPTEPWALLFTARERLVRCEERLVRSRGSTTDAAVGAAGSAAVAAASRAVAVASGGLAGAPAASAVVTDGGTSTLALLPGAAASMGGSGSASMGGFDLSVMSAFLSDPEVLATANRVADSFLEGTPDGAEAAQRMMASFFGLQTGLPPAVPAASVQPVPAPAYHSASAHHSAPARAPPTAPATATPAACADASAPPLSSAAQVQGSGEGSSVPGANRGGKAKVKY